MRRGMIAAALLVAGLAMLATPSPTRAETLADIRAELEALSRDIAGLRGELARSNGGEAPRIDGDTLSRVDRIEAVLARLTGRTEELENRIERIVADATNRLGDLEFRLVEAEGGDPTQLGSTPPLGGATGLAPELPQPDFGTAEDPAPAEDGPLLAADEQRTFEAARAALQDGRAEEAAEMLAQFVDAFPGGPFTERARLLLGQAHRARGARSDAARVNLDLFVSDPEGEHAAPALLALGEDLAELGQTDEACLMFEELSLRFPGTPEAGQGQALFVQTGCVE